MELIRKNGTVIVGRDEGQEFIAQCIAVRKSIIVYQKTKQENTLYAVCRMLNHMVDTLNRIIKED